MPDNGLLSGLFGALQAGAGGPAGQEMGFRRQGFNYLANQLGDPGEAALYMSDPNALNAAWQRQLFIQQLQGLMGPDPEHPRMPLGQALYQMSPEGQKQQYGVTPVPGFKMGDVEAPGTITGGAIQPPPGFTNAPQSVGQTMSPQNAGGTNMSQATPGQGGGLGPMAQTAIDLAARKAAAVKSAEGAATMQPGFPAALTKAHNIISRLESIRDNPNLDQVVGRVAGGLPARYSAQPDLINDIEDANNALKGDVFQSLRSISGRPVSPGALKEMQISDLQSSRVGTAEGYRSNINRLIKQVQDETDAAWVGANSPAEYKPVWGKNEQTPAAQANERAVQFLRAHPEHADQFDAKFGKGASQKVLGNAQRL